MLWALCWGGFVLQEFLRTSLSSAEDLLHIITQARAAVRKRAPWKCGEGKAGLHPSVGRRVPHRRVGSDGACVASRGCPAVGGGRPAWRPAPWCL